MNTVYLDPVSWDLVLDSSGNIALATEPWAVAQDVASALRTFLGEVYYDTSLGVPYWQQVLGVFPQIPLPLLKALLIKAALTVKNPNGDDGWDVVSAQAFISSVSNRTVSGSVQFQTSNGKTLTTGF